MTSSIPNAGFTRSRNRLDTEAPELTLERLREVLAYNPETGEFHWVKRPAGRFGGVQVGKRAGTICKTGYRYIGLDNFRYLEHRLVWFYKHGRWPAAFIDHINGDPLDNRIANLRECTNAENCQNVRKSRGANKHVGVYYARSQEGRRKNCWTASITVGGEKNYLGWFATEEEALAARAEAKARIHPFHPVQETANG